MVRLDGVKQGLIVLCYLLNMEILKMSIIIAIEINTKIINYFFQKRTKL